MWLIFLFIIIFSVDIKSLTRDAAGDTFLTAAQTGLTDILKELYETFKKEQNDDNTSTKNEEGENWLLHYKDEDGYTALHRASYNGHLETVQHLLTIGADVHSTTNDGWTPLHSAARWNKAAIVSLLVQNGAHINALTNGNQTPLHLASCNGVAKETIECLLLEEDCDLSVCNDKGETAQELALSYGKHGYLFEMRDESVECII